MQSFPEGRIISEKNNDTKVNFKIYFQFWVRKLYSDIKYIIYIFCEFFCIIIFVNNEMTLFRTGPPLLNHISLI